MKMSGNPITNQPGSGVTTINFANCKKVFVQRDYSEVSWKYDLLIYINLYLRFVTFPKFVLFELEICVRQRRFSEKCSRYYKMYNKG